jgi:ubiquinone/menaquinone biosynthesis C-methylase UbiE
MIEVKLNEKNKLHLNSSAKVFIPTQTTYDLLDVLKKNIKKKKVQVIDMGCGNGVIGIALLKLFKNVTNVVFADISEDSLKDCEKNLKINRLNTRKHELIVSNVFKRISFKKFDIIINDISGISQLVANISPWFKRVSCESGKNGTRLTLNFLKNYKRYLKKNGKVFFPIISLSNEKIIFSYLKKNNIRYKIISEKKWPIPKSMIKYKGLLTKLKLKNYINFEEQYGLMIANTKIITLI